MKKLKAELARLKKSGGGHQSLASEIESLIEATHDKNDDVPLSQKLLALAAQHIRDKDFNLAHDCVGAAIDAHQAEQADQEVTLPEAMTQALDGLKVTASKNPFVLPLSDVTKDHSTFVEASAEMATSFAHLLINAGYETEAKNYVSAFNGLIKEGKESMSKKKHLEEIKAHFRRTGNMALANAADKMLEEISADGDEATAWSTRASEMAKAASTQSNAAVKALMVKASYMAKTAASLVNDPAAKEDATCMMQEAESMYADANQQGSCASQDSNTEPMNEGDTMSTPAGKETTAQKPVLHVDPPTKEEAKLRLEAQSAAKAGDKRKAREALAKAQELEKVRLVAALIKAGDTDLAMEGLMEEDKDGANAGMSYSQEDADANKEGAEEAEEAAAADEAPTEPVAVEQPTKEPEAPAPVEEPKEEDAAQELSASVVASVKKKDMRSAALAYSKLVDLESEVVAGIKALIAAKKLDVAAEGKLVWKAVRKQRLTAEAFLAKAEGEDEVKEEAMEGMKALEDEAKAEEALKEALDQSAGEDMGEQATAEELTEDMRTPPGGVQESLFSEDLPPAGGEMGEEEGEKEEEEEEHEGGEAEAMHYEVLQSTDDIKAMKVDREALAFTYWEDATGKAPFYVVQAAGKPVAEIHLADQDNAEDIKAYFCDEQKYTQAIAQTVEKTSLYEMLRGVRARFYAHQVEKTALAQKMKQDALASVKDSKNEQLANLRTDFTDAMLVGAEALNKGLSDKPHALKAAFCKVLASYGIQNPAFAVESAFKEGGHAFFEQVIEQAKEYLEMPKEAFAHIRKNVERSNNIAFAQASSLSNDAPIGQRLAQNSLPFASVPEAVEAPNREAEIQASLYRDSDRTQKQNLRNRLKLNKRF